MEIYKRLACSMSGMTGKGDQDCKEFACVKYSLIPSSLNIVKENTRNEKF